MRYEDVQIGMRITSTFHNDRKDRHGVVVERSTRHTGCFILKFDDGLIGSTQNSYAPEYFKPFDWSTASPEELLEEAKRRYPVGCTINPVHVKVGGYKCYVTGIFDIQSDKTVCIKYGSSEWCKKTNGHTNSATVFYKGEWAEIISLPEKTDGYIPIKDRKIAVWLTDEEEGKECLRLFKSVGVHTDFKSQYGPYTLTTTGGWKGLHHICGCDFGLFLSQFRQMVEEELRRNKHPYKVEGNSHSNGELKTMEEHIHDDCVGVIKTYENTRIFINNHKPKTTNNEHKKGKTVSVSKITPKVCRPERGRGKEVSGRRCGFTVEIGSTSDRTVHYKR